MSEVLATARARQPRPIWIVLLICVGISVGSSELACLASYQALGMSIDLRSPSGLVMVLAPAILPAVISPAVYLPLVRSRRRTMLLLDDLQRTSADLRAEVRQRRLAQDRLEYLAAHDELTGTRNRRGFFAVTDETVTGLCIVVDIDAFKRVNDEFGHAAGDRALTAVAAAIRTAVDERAVLARLGGDEFAIYDSQPDETVVRRLTRTLRAVEVELPGYQFTVSATVGAAFLTEPTPIDDALARADAEMYREKSHRQGNLAQDAGSPTA